MSNRIEYFKKWYSKSKARELVIKNKLKRKKRDDAIVTAFKNGMLCAKLKKKYDLSTAQCYRICRGKLGKKYQTYKNRARYGKKDYTLKDLIILCKKLGRLPFVSEIPKTSPMRKAYYRDWRPKLRRLGYRGLRESAKENMLNAILKLSTKLNRMPTYHELQIKYSIHYRNHFGTIKNLHGIIKKSLNNKT